MEIFIQIAIPFFGTLLGAALVFFLKKDLNDKLKKALLGFAAGVMIAASIWSLILPSIELSSDLGKLAFLPATIGFLVGIFFLLILDIIIPHIHFDGSNEGKKSKMSKNFKMFLAVTLHNIPEGLCVGVALSGALYGNNTISIMAALILSIGIAIQNFPEGSIVSLSFYVNEPNKKKAFLLGSLSGLVEPIACVIAIWMAQIFTPILPYFLAFAAGAMLYVVVEELIPETESEPHSNWGTIMFALGFSVMMVLEIVFA